MAQIFEQVQELIQPLLDELGFELVDLEYKREQQGWVLRFFLDKEGGITLDDCAVASREISTLLDVEDIIHTAYNLEVSSPGIERPLKKIADFERFSGHSVKIKTLQSIDAESGGKARKVFTGTLKGLDGEQIILDTDDKKPAEIKIPFALIEKANLKFDF
ncbi:MAG: ribosome maturation factor [Desulfuromonas sp.]|nr:MAG: ribosome maturation factor [Desulfuromonas sp.]